MCFNSGMFKLACVTWFILTFLQCSMFMFYVRTCRGWCKWPLGKRAACEIIGYFWWGSRYYLPEKPFILTRHQENSSVCSNNTKCFKRVIRTCLWQQSYLILMRHRGNSSQDFCNNYNICFQLFYLTKTSHCCRYISSFVCVDKTIHFFYKRRPCFQPYYARFWDIFQLCYFGDKTRCFLTRNCDTSSHVCSDKPICFCRDVGITQGVFVATIQVI